jgi:hypothetical protein
MNYLVSLLSAELPQGAIIGIAAGAALVIAIAIFVIINQKKKKAPSDALFEDKALVAKCLAEVEVMQAKAEGMSADVTKALKSLHEDIEYASPSKQPEVCDIDKKLADKLGDLKIALNKAVDSGDGAAVLKILSGVKVLVAERNAAAKQFRNQ